MTKSGGAIEQPLRSDKAMQLNQQTKSGIRKQRARPLLNHLNETKTTASKGLKRRMLHICETRRAFLEKRLAYMNVVSQEGLTASEGLKRRILHICETRRAVLEKRLAYMNVVSQEGLNKMNKIEQQLASLGIEQEKEAKDLQDRYDAAANISVPTLKKQVADLEMELETCCAKIRYFESSLAAQSSSLTDAVALEFSSMCIGDRRDDDEGAARKNA